MPYKVIKSSGMAILTEQAFYTLTVLNPDTDKIQRLRRQPVVWEAVAQTAIESGAPYIFYANFHKFNVTKLKQKTAANLKKEVFRTFAHNLNLMRNLNLMKKFHELSKVLAQADILFAPLKGISLIIGTYKDEGLRKTADIDIFVHPRDLERAAKLFVQCGYKLKSPMVRGVMENHGQELLFRKDGGPEIDVHYKFFAWYQEKYMYKIDSLEFFERMIRADWNGVSMLFLRKEDELFYILMTIVHSQPVPFRYYLDLDSLIRVHGNTMDWDPLSRRIRQSHLKNQFMKILTFLAQKLNTPIIGSLLPEILANQTDDVRERPVKSFPPRDFFLAENFFDKATLVNIYFKWFLFKKTGVFDGFFRQRNNLVPHLQELTEEYAQNSGEWFLDK